MKISAAFIALLSIQIASNAQQLDTTYFIPNESLSFEIYVPNEASLGQAIFFYDPNANGKGPVKNYRDLADKYSLSLIASNDSRNGPRSSNIDIMKKVLTYVKEQILANNARLYLSGFSGGARASTFHATERSDIAGVIGCGSGFIPNFDMNAIRYAYVGMVGNADMNYLEMINNEQLLSEAKVNNTLIEFQAGHQWPPAKHFGVALSWLLTTDRTSYKSFYSHFSDSLSANQLMIPLQRVNQRLESSNIGPYVTVDVNSKAFKKQQRGNERVYESEVTKQKEILNGLSAIRMVHFGGDSTGYKPFEWWTSLNHQLNRSVKKEDVKGLSSRRIQGFLRANTFEKGAFSIQTNVDLAEKYFHLFNLASNESWWSLYWLSKCKVAKGDWKAFEKYLKLSAEKGLPNFEFVKKDPAFSHQNAQEIIEKVQSNL